MNAEQRFIVDASVVVKWYVDEEEWPQARSLLTRPDRLLAPDLLTSEVGNVFLKKLRTGEMTEITARRGLRDIPAIVSMRTTSSILTSALDIALQHGRSFYDSLYVALALQENCPLITADQRLCNALRPAFGDTMVWLGNLPAEAV